MNVRHQEECGIFTRDARCDCGATSRAVKQLWPAWNDLPQSVRTEALRVGEEKRVTLIAVAALYETMRGAICRSVGVPITAAEQLPKPIAERVVAL